MNWHVSCKWIVSRSDALSPCDASIHQNRKGIKMLETLIKSACLLFVISLLVTPASALDTPLSFTDETPVPAKGRHGHGPGDGTGNGNGSQWGDCLFPDAVQPMDAAALLSRGGHGGGGNGGGNGGGGNGDGGGNGNGGGRGSGNGPGDGTGSGSGPQDGTGNGKKSGTCINS